MRKKEQSETALYSLYRMRVRFLGAALFCAILACPLSAVFALTADEQAALQSQLNQIEKDIANNQATLSSLQSQGASLERDIDILNSKIKNAQLQIKQTDLTLSQLRAGIADKQKGIATVDTQVAKGQESLAQIIRETREMDDTDLSAILLSKGSLSDAFREIDDFDTIKKALQDSFQQMTALRTDLSQREAALQDQEDEAQKVRQVQVLAQQAVQSDEKEKQQLLSQTKGQEKNYQAVIADKQKQAAAIREALFSLRDSGAIPFGTAYQYAKEASVSTGVRPAVILAIMTEETNLGENIGSCSYHEAMNPTRDIPVFITLMQDLGLNPEDMKVSCKPSYGWGGAMGPAQFIPSTWVLYKSRLASITGQNPPNPYDGRTAIFATALLMADNGADGGTRTAERRAALKYFAGGNWSKPAYAFYGDNVMDIADKLQGEIDIIAGASS